MTEQQKFLLWQYADLVARIDRAQQQSGTEEIVEVMLGEKARMEDEYEVLYGEKPALPPPPPPPWWY